MRHGNSIYKQSISGTHIYRNCLLSPCCRYFSARVLIFQTMKGQRAIGKIYTSLVKILILQFGVPDCYACSAFSCFPFVFNLHFFFKQTKVAPTPSIGEYSNYLLSSSESVQPNPAEGKSSQHKQSQSHGRKRFGTFGINSAVDCPGHVGRCSAGTLNYFACLT